MKKTVIMLSLIAMFVLLSMTAFAGDIPESLLSSDEAQVFFGEVVAYHPDKENPDIEVSPVKKIKGDIKLGTKQIYYKPNPMGNMDVKVGNVYLFTYYDENNPTDIFEVTSYDTKTLKLKGVSGDMWERFEKYLNDGEYEKAEVERCKIPFTEVLGIARDQAETVEIHAQNNAYTIDTKKFYDIADNIILTDVEDEDMTENEGNKGNFPDGMYITVNGVDIGYAFVTYDGRVDKCGLFMSRLPYTDYIMNKEDLEKLCSLLPVDVKIAETVETNGIERKLPPLSGHNQIYFNLFMLYALPALMGIVLRLIFIKWKRGYVITGVTALLTAALWLRAELINTHGSEGPAILALMAGMMTAGALLVGAIAYVVKKRHTNRG